jgi:hypothetical protein
MHRSPSSHLRGLALALAVDQRLLVDVGATVAEWDSEVEVSDSRGGGIDARAMGGVLRFAGMPLDVCMTPGLLGWCAGVIRLIARDARCAP